MLMGRLPLIGGPPLASSLAPAVAFPGTSGEGYDRGSHVSIVDTSAWSFSGFIYPSGTGNRVVFIGAGTRKEVLITSGGQVRLQLKNLAGTTIFSWTSTTTLTADAWNDVQAYANLAVADDFYVQINGTQDATAASTFLTGETIDNIGGRPAVGGNVALGLQNFNGRLSNCAQWNRKIDWSAPATSALVRSAAGKCVQLPNDGNIDGGGLADHVFNKPRDMAHQNGGLGGDWATATAGLSDADGPELA